MKKLIFTCLLGIILSTQIKAQVFYTTDFVNSIEEKNALYPPSYDIYCRIYELTDTMKYKIFTDTMDLTLVNTIMLSGNSNQYVRGNGTLATFPTQVTSTSQLVNNSGFLTSEVDGSVTNEIELPSQTGNSGKVLSTTGTVTTWVNSSSGTVTSVGLTSTDFTVSGSPVTTSGNITANLTTTGVSTGTYDWVTVDNKGRVTAAGNTPLPTAIASGARNFNQAYQLSSTRPSFISISAQLSCNLSLTGGQAGNIQLQLSANGSSGWVTYGTLTASNTGTLTIGLNTTQVSGGQLTVPIPVGYYWRALTTNTTGTPTYTFNGGYEIVY